VLVTHGFLRSLARLELEESAVGRFAVPEPPASGTTPEPGGELPSQLSTPLPTRDRGEPTGEHTVGDTPWAVVIPLLVVGIGAGVAALTNRRPRRPWAPRG
jgi:hypothetical protein